MDELMFLRCNMGSQNVLGCFFGEVDNIDNNWSVILGPLNLGLFRVM